MDSENPETPPTCAAGCGFFGNPACENYCSKCYRDLKKSEGGQPLAKAPTTVYPIVPSSPIPQTTAAAAAAPAAAAAVAPAADVAAAGAESAPKKAKKKKNRCAVCRTNVGMLGFSCRCSGLFCAHHRQAEAHECTFDYVTHDRAILAKNNEQVVADKMDRI